MVKKFPYWFWVIWACVTWAIALILAWKLNTHDRLHNVIILLVGFALGAFVATIARKIYKLKNSSEEHEGYYRIKKLQIK